MIPQKEDRNLKESKFVVNFTNSMFETYMKALANLNLREKFELEVIDIWEGNRIPRVISLYRKEFTLDEDISRLKAEVVRLVKDYSEVDKSKYPKRDFWPLMTIQSYDVPTYQDTIRLIKLEVEQIRTTYYTTCINPDIILTPLCVSNAYDRDFKHFLYPNGGLFHALQPTDLLKFLVRVGRKVNRTTYEVNRASYDEMYRQLRLG